MKITINKTEHDATFNYVALKKIQELTGKKISSIIELDEFSSVPIFLASAVYGAAYLKDKTITELPVSVDECIDLLNEDLSIFNEVIAELTKALTNAYVSKNEKGAN